MRPSGFPPPTLAAASLSHWPQGFERRRAGLGGRGRARVPWSGHLPASSSEKPWPRKPWHSLAGGDALKFILSGAADVAP